ncbi:MAG: gamma-glutamyltransferase family protein [Phycisphaerales bacterium]|nr:gamma-glutamyltransferase family protein [Phycisphaerales bacterium]
MHAAAIPALIPCSGDLPYPSQRQLVFGSEMVATSQPLAAQAGLEMLRRGGSAVDAAIATAAVLTVTEPTTNGIGGDAFALVWDGSSLHGANGSGRSPAALTAEHFAGRATMPTEGWLPITVPGQVALWADLSKKFGRLLFADLLAPAIDYARDGYQVAPLTAALWHRAAVTYTKRDNTQEWQETFLQDGAAPMAGARVRLPHHARTLEMIAQSDGRAMYEGELAQAIDAASRAHGGHLRAQDLASHRSDFTPPISQRYRGFRVHEIAPNGQGIAALIALAILERFDIGALSADCPDALHLSIESIKLGFADAHAHIADPAHMRITTDELLSSDRIDALVHRIDRTRAQDFSRDIPKPGGTVYLCAADSRGMMVSFIQSNYMGFGSGVVIPRTGIAMQNRGACFTLQGGHPNCVAGGKRPFHTIIPGFVTRITDVGDEAAMAFGVMGGFMQPQGHTQIITRMIDHGQNPQAALDAPRWQWMREMQVQLEPGFDPATIAELQSRGHQITLASERSVTFGRGQAIVRMRHGWMGASDLRADGLVAVR